MIVVRVKSATFRAFLREHLYGSDPHVNHVVRR
jgi:hypothetical protein